MEFFRFPQKKNKILFLFKKTKKTGFEKKQQNPGGLFFWKKRVFLNLVHSRHRHISSTRFTVPVMWWTQHYISQKTMWFEEVQMVSYDGWRANYFLNVKAHWQTYGHYLLNNWFGFFLALFSVFLKLLSANPAHGWRCVECVIHHERDVHNE